MYWRDGPLPGGAHCRTLPLAGFLDVRETRTTHRETKERSAMSTMSDPAAAVATLASIPGQLDTLIERGAELPPQSGAAADWTPSEILGHLCDSARYWGARMYRVAHEDEPELPPFDENGMVQLAAYR